MSINFTKMHSLGNDFVVIDAINQRVDLNPVMAKRIADRYTGVGCDQILLAERPTNGRADFRFRIFNADGSEVAQCGNGARCFARFLIDQQLTDKRNIHIETNVGYMVLSDAGDGKVVVNLGVPVFEPAHIPFAAEQRQDRYELKLSNDTVTISCVAVGNPHAVQIVDNVETAPVAEQGPEIENHSRFPERVNAGFMQIVSNNHIRVRVYERGVGETQACGSGICAAVITGKQLGLLSESVHVEALGGDAHVDWRGEGEDVYLTGPAHTVFTGSLNLELS